MRHLIAATLIIAGSLVVATGAGAQSPGPVDPTTLGPQVGEQVPAFTLVDHRGEARTLESLYGPEGLMLVFNRSASW